jgi:hypothetical protein
MFIIGCYSFNEHKSMRSTIAFIFLAVSLSACHHTSDTFENVSLTELQGYKQLTTTDTLHSLHSGNSDRILVKVMPVTEQSHAGVTGVNTADSVTFSPSKLSLISFSAPDSTTIIEKRNGLPDRISYRRYSRLVLTQQKPKSSVVSGSYLINLNAAVKSLCWLNDTTAALKIHPIKQLAKIDDNTYEEQIDQSKIFYLNVLIKPLEGGNKG